MKTKKVTLTKKVTKKGTKKQVPTLLQAFYMSEYELSQLTSATQRKLLVKLNRISNKRLEDITKDLNKNKVKPSILSEQYDLFNKIQQKGNKYKFSRFTAGRNLTKSQMQEQIRERLLFLDSPFSSTKGYNEVIQKRKKALLDQYNKSMGYTPDDPNYRKRLTNKQFEDFGKLLNRLRAGHLLSGSGVNADYVNTMKIAAEVMTQNKKMSVDEWYKEIEKLLDEQQKQEAARRKANTDILFGGWT